MMDRISAEDRSKIMSRVKQRDTKPEIIVRSLLHKLGYRFRLHRKDLPGTPDIFLPKYSSVIFVHGCFWHGHSCKRGKLPETRKDFWTAKLLGNVARDKRNIIELHKLGYRTLVLWQCELNEPETIANRLNSFFSLDNTGELSGSSLEAK